MRKQKKDTEKAKKKAWERGKRQQGSDEEATDDDGDDDNADEEEDECDNIPWDKLVRDDDAGTTL